MYLVRNFPKAFAWEFDGWRRKGLILKVKTKKEKEIDE
jgi:hypothetical protein